MVQKNSFILCRLLVVLTLFMVFVLLAVVDVHHDNGIMNNLFIEYIIRAGHGLVCFSLFLPYLFWWYEQCIQYFFFHLFVFFSMLCAIGIYHLADIVLFQCVVQSYHIRVVFWKVFHVHFYLNLLLLVFTSGSLGPLTILRV